MKSSFYQLWTLEYIWPFFLVLSLIRKMCILQHFLSFLPLFPLNAKDCTDVKLSKVRSLRCCNHIWLAQIKCFPPFCCLVEQQSNLLTTSACLKVDAPIKMLTKSTHPNIRHLYRNIIHMWSAANFWLVISVDIIKAFGTIYGHFCINLVLFIYLSGFSQFLYSTQFSRVYINADIFEAFSP